VREPDPRPYERLSRLAESDLDGAIGEALSIATSPGDPQDRCSAAGALVDLGNRHDNTRWVRTGLATIKRQARSEPENGLWQYQLGTAYLTLADMAHTPAHQRGEAERRDRVRGRRALWESAISEFDPGLCAQAWINLGNDLLRSARYTEAYGAYQEALEVAPNHPVAAGYAASTLFTWARQSGITGGNLIALAHHWARVAQRDAERADAIAQGSSRIFAKFPTDRADEAIPPRAGEYGGYEAFVAHNRLYLTWALDGAMHASHWDNLRPPAIRTAIDDPENPPAIFSMLNTVKADYLLARSLAWEAMSPRATESPGYVDTLDYAVYGDESARLVLATRAALDTLDRVAVAANHHFQIGLDPTEVNFRNLWRETARPRDLRQVVSDEVKVGNAALYALAEVADDLSGNGWLEGRQRFRNVTTHRFAVVHPDGFPIPPSTVEMKHLSVPELDAEVVAALSAARSGILYLYGAIGHRSRRMKTDRSVELQLPTSKIRARNN
jgi:hypothetical protein